MVGDELDDDFNEHIDMCVLSIATCRADENWNSARVICLDKNGQVAFMPSSRDFEGRPFVEPLSEIIASTPSIAFQKICLLNPYSSMPTGVKVLSSVFFSGEIAIALSNWESLLGM
jgi:hypothetical protein